MKPHEFKADGVTIRVFVRNGSHYDADEWNNLNAAEKRERLAEHATYPTATRVFVGKCPVEGMPPYTKRGEDPANDARWDAYNAAEIQAMRGKYDRVCNALMDFLGVEVPAAEKMTFSRYAGCGTCSCSSGLLTPEAIVTPVGDVIDAVYIDY